MTVLAFFQRSVVNEAESAPNSKTLYLEKSIGDTSLDSAEAERPGATHNVP